jgi:DNA-binding SARP family transcriptional activator/Flp pilus assembly protein TadD
MSGVSLLLLGKPTIERDGVSVEVDTRKAIALLAYLAVNHQPFQRDTLAALLWSEYDQTSARADLRRTLSTLNKTLREDFILASRESLELNSSCNLWVDANEFLSLIDTTRKHNHISMEICQVCQTSLEKAASLYHGQFLEGFSLRDSPAFDEWQFFQGEKIQHELAFALEILTLTHGKIGNFDSAIDFARQWINLDPLREDAHRALMVIYASSGQRNAALRQYKECARILDQELNVVPLEETIHLYQEILTGRWDSGHQPGAATENRSRSIAKPSPAPAIKEGFFSEPPLVDRVREWRTLTGLVEYSGPHGHFISIAGEAGIGKTRLAEDYLAFIGNFGGTVLAARCFEGETFLAYGPFVEGLRQAATQPDQLALLKNLPTHILGEMMHLLPELVDFSESDSSQIPAGSSTAQARFFEAVRQTLHILLSGPKRGIFFLDDLQWADSASLDLLTYLARRMKGAGFFLMAAWREENGLAVERLRSLRDEVQRNGMGIHFSLRRLDQLEINELARNMLPPNQLLTQDFSQRLFQDSEGLPFFAVEYLRSIKETASQEEMPESVRSLLHQRLQAISGPACQLMSAAAVIGRSFDFYLLHEVSGRSELETIEGLENLARHSIITEGHPSGHEATEIYDFTHEKLRQLIYDETGLARRRLLHHRIADALINRGRAHGEIDTTAAKIAFHYKMSGEVEQAAEYYRRAGDHARSVHANAEALNLYQSALEAGRHDQSELYEAIADIQTLSGTYLAAIKTYQMALVVCEPKCRGRMLHKLGEVYHRMGDWENAEMQYLEAQAVSGESLDPTWQVRLFSDRSLNSYRLGQPDQAMVLARQAVELASNHQNPEGLAQALNTLGILTRAGGDLEQAASNFQQSLDTAARFLNQDMQCAAMNNLSLVLKEQGNFARAISYTKQAIDLCKLISDRHHEAALHNNLADLYHLVGNEEEAMAELKKAVVIFAEIGEKAGRELPEIWKLTEW